MPSIRRKTSGDSGKSYERPVIVTGGLIGCCFALLFLAGCGSPMTEQQKTAMAHFQDLGGRINSKRGGYEIDLTNTQVQNKDLALLKDIPNLITLDLSGTQINDDSLPYLRALDKVELIVVARTLLSNDGIEGLREAMKERKAIVRR